MLQGTQIDLHVNQCIGCLTLLAYYGHVACKEGCCEQVENLALEKWGGQEKLDAEKEKRHKKRLEREKEKAGKSMSRWSHAQKYGLQCIEMLSKGQVLL